MSWVWFILGLIAAFFGMSFLTKKSPSSHEQEVISLEAKREELKKETDKLKEQAIKAEEEKAKELKNAQSASPQEIEDFYAKKPN